MPLTRSHAPIKKRQIENLQIINEDVANAAGIVTSKLADGALFIKSDGTVAFGANQSHGGYKITNLGQPTSDNDAVRLIDLQTAQIPKEACRVSTTPADGNQTLTGLLTIDSVTVSATDRVLIKNQTDASENGIYVAATGAWSRSVDADEADELVAGSSAFILEGTINAYTSWTQSTTGTIVVDTTDLVWVQGYAALEIVAGAGLTRTSNTIDATGTTDRILVNADSIDISPNYIGQSSITTLGTIISGIWNGTAIANANLANSSITFALGTSGNDIGLSGSAISLGQTLTVNVPSASSTKRGLLTSADWITFNNKQAALGYTPITNVLTNGYILVGSVSNVATAVTVSGEASLINTGALTLLNSAVIGKVLTGYTATSGTLSASDSILSAIQKLGYDKHVAVTLKSGSQSYIELSGQELNATTINLGAAYVTGTISSAILGNSSLHIGTTQIALNRASAAQSLTGITAIDGTASAWTTARLLAGNSVSGSANVPFANKFIVQGTTDAGLTGAQFLGVLSTGLVKNTTTTGVLSIVPDNTANWDSAYNDTILSSSFGISTGTLTLTQRDAGTVVTSLDGRYLIKTGSLLNNEWFTSYDYAGNVAGVFKVSKDNLIEFGFPVAINSFFHVLNSGVNDIVNIPVSSESPVGQEHGVNITIGGTRVLGVSMLSDGAGSVNGGLLTLDASATLTGTITAAANASSGAYDLIVRKQSNGAFEKIASTTYDKYTSWSFAVNGTTYDGIVSAGVLNFKNGSNISISRSAPNEITIANTYLYTHPAYTPITAQSLTGANVFSSIVVDALGSVTSLSTRALTASDVGADNYNNWKFATNGTTQDSITTGGVLNFKNGGNVSIIRSALNEITIASSSSDITYSQAAVSSTGGAILRLTSSGAINDDIKFANGSNISIAYTDDNTITVANTYSYTHPAKTWVDKTDLSGASVISNLTIDSLGHPTAWTTRALTLANLGYSGVADADRYNNWNLKVNSGAATQILSNDNVTFISSTGISLATSGKDLTITNTGVTSVALSVPTGLEVSGSPITTTGTLAISMAAGYSIPTNAKQASWDAGVPNGTVNRLAKFTTTSTIGNSIVTTSGSDILMLSTYSGAGSNMGNLWIGSGTEGQSSNVGGYNVGIGGLAMSGMNVGSYNVALGFQALSKNTSGSNNLAAGFSALYYSTGTGNSALGNYAMGSIITGDYNTAIGASAGEVTNDSYANTSSSNSIFIGAGSRTLAVGSTNEVVVGFNTSGHGSNTATWGNISIADHYFSGNIRLYSSAPKLYVGVGMSPGVAGQALLSGGPSGSLYWGTVSGGGSSIPSGTVTGQMMWWNNSGSTWNMTNTAYLRYEDTTGKLYVGSGTVAGSTVDYYLHPNSSGSTLYHVELYRSANARGPAGIINLSYPDLSGNTTAGGNQLSLGRNGSTVDLVLGDGSNSTNAYIRLPRYTSAGILKNDSEGVVSTIMTTVGGTRFLREDGTWAVTGSGGGTGTVTSVNMSVPTGLSISGNPITTSGTLALSLTSGYTIPQTAYQILNDNASSKVSTIVTLTQTAYNTLSPKIATTMYVIVG